jgi:PAS domain S-box-containing protein
MPMDYKLEDLIDIPLIQNLQEKLNAIYSFPSAIISNDGKILTAVAWQDICTKFHRLDPLTEKYCIKSDQYIFSHISDANPSVSYTCPFGLADNALPIIIDGNHLGNFFTGQFFLKKPDLNFFKKQAKKYGFDEKEYLKSVALVPVMTKEKVAQYLDFIKGFIEIIAGIGLNNLRTKKTNTALTASIERNQSIIQSTTDWIWETDEHARYCYCSDKIEEILGYKVNEIIGKTPFDFMKLAESDRVSKIFNKIFEKKCSITNLENWCVHKDGHEVCLLTNGSPVTDDSGKITGFRGADKDITERKLSERAFQETFDELKKSQKLARLGNWKFDLLTEKFTASEEVLHIFGFPDDSQPNFQELSACIHTQDQELAKINLKDILHTGEKYNLELRILKKDTGELRNIILLADLQRDENNNPVTLYGTYQDITERKQIEQYLKESETKYRLIAENTSDTIAVFDLDLRFTYVSPSVKKILGYTQEEFLQLKIDQVLTPESLKHALKLLEKYIPEEMTGTNQNTNYPNIELEEYHKNGGTIWVELSFSFLKDSNNKPYGITTLTRDITERKLSEEYRDQQLYFTKALNEIAEVIISSENTEEILETSNRIIGETLKLDRALIYDVSFEKNEIEGLSEWLGQVHPEIEKTKGKYPLEMFLSPFTEIRNTKKHLESHADTVSEIFRHDQSGEILHDHFKIKSLLWFPFAFYEHGYYLFTLNQILEQRKWTKEEIGFLESVAKQVNLALIKIRLLEEKEKAEEAIKENEDKYRTMIDYSNDLIWTLDNHGCFVFFNEKTSKITGLTLDEWSGKSFIPLIIEEDLPMIMAIFQRNMSGEACTYELRFKKPDESILTISVNTSPIFKSGKINGIVSFGRDITESKKAEAELLQKTEELNNYFTYSLDLFCIADTDGFFIHLNKVWESTLGYTLQDLEGKSFLDFVHSEDLNSTLEAISNLRSQHEVLAFVNRYRCKDNTYRWIEWQAYPSGKLIYAAARDITDRKMAEIALRDSEEKYRLIAENTSDGILIIGSDTKIQYTSPSYIKQLGYTEDEELSRDSDNIYQMLHPDDRDQVFSDIFEAIKLKNKELTYTFRVKHKDGHYFWREDKARFNFDIDGNHINTYVICRDIDKRKQTEQSLLESESRFRRYLMNAPDGIFVVDENGIYIETNAAAERITGYSRQELLGTNILNIILPDDLDLAEEHFRTVTNAGEAFSEIHFIRKDGVIRQWSVKAVKLTDTLFIGFVSDITERKKDEQELKKAKEKAEESDRLKTAFLANMSHEIRTPMNGILGFAELLKEPDNSGEEQLEYIRVIEKSGRRMLNIINDIVDISKIESGQMEVTLVETNINTQIEFIYDFFKPETDAKGIHLIVKSWLPKHLANTTTDPEKVYAILTNIVKNAIKYTHNGSIEIGVLKKGKQLEFFVKDTGIGIPKERQEAIFERFIQADISDKNAYQGAGLGLAISKAYVKMLGGEIWVESNNDAFSGETNSTFHFTIQDHAHEKPELIRNKDENAEINQEPFNHLKILLVDDDVSSVFLLSRIIKHQSREILIAHDGSEAIEACRNHPDIDLVLMDVKMPGINGFEATRTIRQFNKNVVIIAQTAYALMGDRQKVIDAGCNDYLTKPIRKQDLFLLINQYFNVNLD